MAASEVTEKKFQRMPGMDVIAKVTPAEQYDWVIFKEYKGITLLTSRLIAGGAAGAVRGQLAVNNGSTAYTATTMAIAYDIVGVTANTGVPRSDQSFYVETVSGEILEVFDATSDTSTGTLTVIRRGCFGTTPSATGIADNNILYVLNNLVVTDSQTSPIEMLIKPLPNDPEVRLFS